MFSNLVFQNVLPCQKRFSKLLFIPQAFLGSFLRFAIIGFIFVLSNDKLSLDVAFFKGEIAYKR